MKTLAVLSLMTLLFIEVQAQTHVCDSHAPDDDTHIPFVLQGNKWDCRYVTYFFMNGTDDVPGTAEHDAVREAISWWDAFSNVDLIEVCNEAEADIRIAWNVGDHGDGRPHDNGGGATNVLAHAFFPPPHNGALAGDLHFDDFENWSVDGSGQDVFSTALHEIGHSLGLLHSTDLQSVMFAPMINQHTALTLDDVLGIRAIYGAQKNPVFGPGVVCMSGADFTLEQFTCLKPGFTITWSTSSQLSIVSGQGTSTVTVKALGDQVRGTVTATISSGCDQRSYTRATWVGKPKNLNLKGRSCYKPGDHVVLRATASGANHFRWKFPNCPNGKPHPDPDPECWYNYDGDGPDNSISVYVGEQCNGSISVWASNECGEISRNFPIVCCEDDDDGGGRGGPIMRFGGGTNQYMKLYPNPTSGSLVVELNAEYFREGEAKIIEVAAINGQLLRQVADSKNKIEIDLTDFANGQYYLTIANDEFILGNSIILTK